VLEVSQLNEYVKQLVGTDDVLSSIGVRGELSNYKIYPSGHHYFTMKDASASLRCVMFKNSADKLRWKPKDGTKAVALGHVEVYVRDGQYQLYVSHMTPDGVGDLYTEYERLKEKLRLEGLFDEKLKKKIPVMPRTIAVVTSSAGAAVRDIIRVLCARWPLTKVLILPVRVQGAEAPAEIAGALKYCNAHNLADLIITGRGGGSIEDLWAFNDERVARAIFASEIPVISAVGHEPDYTIADFVADLRAATPSNAAELAVPDISDVRGYLNNQNNRLLQASSQSLKVRRQRLETLANTRVMRSPRNYLDDRRLALDRAGERLFAAANMRAANDRAQLARLAASLDALSPIRVLGRGYAIARDADGTVIRSAKDVKSGDKLKIRLQKDEIGVTAE
jgi:exodeoxyribonuclease VII large subunit